MAAATSTRNCVGRSSRWLKPGVQLDEVSLAAQFGLSRSPVRDALARLVTEAW